MVNTFPVGEAQIIALFMEAVAYGIYLVTLGLCARALLWRRAGTRERCNWPLIAVALAMLTFTTLDVSFGLKHVLDAFVFYHGSGGADAEFENISYWVNVMKTVDTQIMTLIGDGMLIYRCFIVFSHFRPWLVIALPALLWLGNAACSGAIIYITATLRQNALLNVNSLSPLVTAFLVITLVNNLLTTGLIVWQIWTIDSETARWQVSSFTNSRSHRRPQTRLARAMRIIVESGLLYTTLVLVTFGTELAGSNAVYGVSDVMIMTVGISFNLIIIRVHEGLAVGKTFPDTQHVGSLPLHFRSEHSHHSTTGMDIEVTIESTVDCDLDGSGHTKDTLSEMSVPKVQWEAI